MTLTPKLSSSMEATMSKLGRVNLELQEQANELGFSTVQEALDNGYEVDYENETLKAPQEAAHKAWLKEKDEVLALLNKTIYRMRCATVALHKDSVPNGTIKAYVEWNEQCAKDLERVKDFVKKGEV